MSGAAYWPARSTRSMRRSNMLGEPHLAHLTRLDSPTRRPKLLPPRPVARRSQPGMYTRPYLQEIDMKRLVIAAAVLALAACSTESQNEAPADTAAPAL